ncbi:hypothetical protein J3F84DRAFT_370744 [Trichoderma pleuroticola]
MEAWTLGITAAEKARNNNIVQATSSNEPSFHKDASSGSEESSHSDKEESITEEATEEEASDEDVSDEEIVPRLLNAEGKRVASPTPPGDQPLDKRPRQSTAEEEFDIAKLVEAIENPSLWKMSQNAALWEECESHLEVLVEKVVTMGNGACEEREEMREDWEEEAKY